MHTNCNTFFVITIKIKGYYFCIQILSIGSEAGSPSGAATPASPAGGGAGATYQTTDSMIIGLREDLNAVRQDVDAIAANMKTLTAVGDAARIATSGEEGTKQMDELRQQLSQGNTILRLY